MQTYQYEQISADPDKPLGDNVRALTDADIERYIIFSSPSSNLKFIASQFYRIQAVQTMDDLKDVYAHFLLHYGRDIPKMQVNCDLLPIFRIFSDGCVLPVTL